MKNLTIILFTFLTMATAYAGEVVKSYSGNDPALFHLSGYSEGAAWVTDPRQALNSHVVYGPYAYLNPGSYTAQFQLSIDQNQGPDDYVVTLDVWDSSQQKRLASKSVTRFNFLNHDDAVEFELPFVASGNNLLEYRIVYHGAAKLSVHAINIVKEVNVDYVFQVNGNDTRIYHAVGKTEATSWAVQPGAGNAVLTYGPYINLPSSDYEAHFELSLEQVINRANTLAAIDVYDSTSRAVLARRFLTGIDFPRASLITKFTLPFSAPIGNSLEFRVFYYNDGLLKHFSTWISGEKQIKNTCQISVKSCPRHPEVRGSFVDSDPASSTSSQACLARAHDYAYWCESKDDVTAKFRANENVLAEKTITTSCHLTITSCPDHPDFQGTFMDDGNGSDVQSAVCSQRATDFYRWCGTGASPVTSRFFQSGQLINAKPVNAAIDHPFAAEQQIATPGQSLFHLKEFTFQPNTQNLLVFVNGQRYTNFQENSGSSVPLNTAMAAGSQVEFFRFRKVQPSDYPGVRPTPTLTQKVSVVDFGADGTGQKDSTQAFRLAFQSSNQILVPAGQVFRVSETIFIDKYISIEINGKIIGNSQAFDFNAGVKAYGQGQLQDLYFQLTNGSANNAISVTGLEFSGQGIPAGAINIGYGQFDEVRILNNVFHDTEYGIYRGPGGNLNSAMKDAVIAGNLFYNLRADAVEWDIVPNDSNIRVIGNLVKGINNDGPHKARGIGIGFAGHNYNPTYDPKETVKDFKIVDNFVSDVRQGIHVEVGDRFEITRNVVRNIRSDYSINAGIDLAGIIVYQGRNFSIRDNLLQDKVGMGAFSIQVVDGERRPVPGVFAYPSYNYDVTGNVVSGYDFSCQTVLSAGGENSFVKMKHNSFSSPVELRGRANQVMIEGNNISVQEGRSALVLTLNTTSTDTGGQPTSGAAVLDVRQNISEINSGPMISVTGLEFVRDVRAQGNNFIWPTP